MWSHCHFRLSKAYFWHMVSKTKSLTFNCLFTSKSSALSAYHKISENKACIIKCNARLMPWAPWKCPHYYLDRPEIKFPPKPINFSVFTTTMSVTIVYNEAAAICSGTLFPCVQLPKTLSWIISYISSLLFSMLFILFQLNVWIT